jgi:hypothetical protein
MRKHAQIDIHSANLRKYAQTCANRFTPSMFAHVCAWICANNIKTPLFIELVYLRKHEVYAYLRNVCAMFALGKLKKRRGQLPPPPFLRKHSLRNVCACLCNVCAMFAPCLRM